MAAISPSRPWNVGITVFLLFGLLAVALLGLLLASSLRIWIWVGTLLLLTIFALVVGRGVTGNWLGLLVDNRQKMSLARFQALLWSILILSAFLAAAITNLPLVGNPTAALSIEIPPQLLTILGISLTSLAGQSLILNTKNSRDPLMVDRNAGGAADRADGPSWYDIFKGDDTANAQYLDLSKVQMFYITLILVLVYGAALASMFLSLDPRHPIIGAFPALDSTIVGLLGISQAGYLTYKAIPRDPTTPALATQAKILQQARTPPPEEDPSWSHG